MKHIIYFKVLIFQIVGNKMASLYSQELLFMEIFKISCRIYIETENEVDDTYQLVLLDDFDNDNHKL